MQTSVVETLNEKYSSSPDPSTIRDDVRTNPLLEDNIEIIEIGGGGPSTLEEQGYDLGTHRAYRIEVSGKIYDGGLNGGRGFQSIQSLDGLVAGDGNIVYELNVNIETTSSIASADWAILPATGSNYATLGGSGAFNPIYLNSSSNGILSFTGAHEFLHTFGLWHQANQTRALTSYAFNRERGADYRRLTFSEAHRLGGAY